MRILKLVLSLSILLVASAKVGDSQAVCCSITISGSAASVQISTSSTPVHWVQLVAPTGNMSTAYWSLGTVATASGNILPAGAGQFLPPKSQGGYDLANVYVYVAMGDTLRVSWDPF